MNQPVEALIVSVGYADYLRLTLPHNLPHFSTVHVVTSLHEQPTQTVLEQTFDCSGDGFRLHRTDAFYTDHAPFAKSRGQNAVMPKLHDGWVVSMDADIVISPKIKAVFDHLDALDKSCIYGPIGKYHVQRGTMGSNLHSDGKACAGFFQLFHMGWLREERGGLFPTTSQDCSHDDIAFSTLFREVRYLAMAAYHFGPSMEDGIPNVNWQGRVSESCPLGRWQVPPALEKDGSHVFLEAGIPMLI
jgi:hypothetical protein